MIFERNAEMEQKKNHANDVNISDESIINMYWERNERAIKATEEKYGAYLYTISYNILHDRLDSEECLNDTYLTTWNKIPPAKPVVFQGFLSKITRDLSVDKYRKTRAERRIPSELIVSLDELNECIGTETQIEPDDEVSEISRVLNEFLKSLSERDRFIFVCRYYYSDPIAYIAKMAGISDKTVYREISRLREELRECLKREGIYL